MQLVRARMARSKARRQRMKKTNTPMNDKLMRKSCGRRHGVKQECPTKGKVCFKCNKSNHYSRMCRSKAVNDIRGIMHEPNHGTDEFFIGTVDCHGEDKVFVQLKVGDGQAVKVKLDTGAQVNVIPADIYRTLGKDTNELRPTKARLTAYGGNNIEVLGPVV